jgi:hypothetical protein
MNRTEPRLSLRDTPVKKRDGIKPPSRSLKLHEVNHLAPPFKGGVGTRDCHWRTKRLPPLNSHLQGGGGVSGDALTNNLGVNP